MRFGRGFIILLSLLLAGLILLAMALSLLRVHGQAAAAVRRHTLRPAPTLVALKVKLSN